MSEELSTILDKKVLQLIGLVLDGPMTVETYMESLHILGHLLRSSVKTTAETTSQAGSANSISKWTTQEDKSEQLSTKSTEQPKQQSSTQPFRCQCLCHYCERQGIHNAKRRK